MIDTSYSEAAERNKHFILDVLRQYISNEAKGNLLEIGSGTGQHAVFFSKQFKNLKWSCSDRPENHKSLKAVLKENQIENLDGPFSLTVGKDDFPSKKPYQYVFSANTLHIMSWKECKTLFKLLGKRLREGSLVFFYGPFNYNGEFTSPSNEQFDQFLKKRDPKSGIRNFEDIVSSMEKSNFKIIHDHEMPANNRVLVFEHLAYKN